MFTYVFVACVLWVLFWFWNPEGIHFSPTYFWIQQAKQSCIGWVSILVGHLSPSCCSTNFLFSFCPRAATSCDILVGDQNQNCLFIFLHSALPLLAMDLCWTSTSASAGGDSTIQAEWRSMALKVGYKSLCDIKIHFAVGCQIKTLNLSKVSFWDLWKKQTKKKKQPLISVDSHTFWLKSILCLWMGILGLVRVRSSVKVF